MAPISWTYASMFDDFGYICRSYRGTYCVRFDLVNNESDLGMEAYATHPTAEAAEKYLAKIRHRMTEKYAPKYIKLARVA